MENPGKAAERLISILPELEDGRGRDVELLLKLGFEPMSQRTGMGAFHEWTREIRVNGGSVFVMVICGEDGVRASATGKFFTLKESASGKDVEEALEPLLRKIRESMKWATTQDGSLEI